ncbi:MAG: hypothetical protein KIG14_02475 [Candidatus Sacchiramonaceae bacterium]|nr:hypothetical protein [Candidatus Saccharimonadaceae bacterium]
MLDNLIRLNLLAAAIGQIAKREDRIIFTANYGELIMGMTPENAELFASDNPIIHLDYNLSFNLVDRKFYLPHQDNEAGQGIIFSNSNGKKGLFLVRGSGKYQVRAQIMPLLNLAEIVESLERIKEGALQITTH